MAPLRTSDLVREFGIPEATWRWWRHRGEGPRSFKLGRTVFYERDDIDDWLVAQKSTTAKGGAVEGCISATQSLEPSSAGRSQGQPQKSSQGIVK